MSDMYFSRSILDLLEVTQAVFQQSSPKLTDLQFKHAHTTYHSKSETLRDAIRVFSFALRTAVATRFPVKVVPEGPRPMLNAVWRPHPCHCLRRRRYTWERETQMIQRTGRDKGRKQEYIGVLM